MAQSPKPDYITQRLDIVGNKKDPNNNMMDTTHISGALESYEAARSGFFIFMPANKDDQVLSYIATKMKSFDTECNYRGVDIQELLKLNVTSANVPHFSLATLEYRRGNEVVKFAGVPTFDAGSIRIDDIVGVDTKSIAEAWLELAYDLETRTGGRMYEYKMNCNLIEYTQDYRPIRAWTLEGCWISNMSEQPFDKESDGQRKIELTIQYDRATMVRGNLTAKGSDTNKVLR